MTSGERGEYDGERLQPAPPSRGLEAVLDQYLEELAEGRRPDQGEYLSRYPELADALRGVFKTLDFVEATGRALQATPLQRGQTLGEFRIVREVARGGMGVVYEAVQTSLNRRVALKVLPMAALLSASGPERFLREAQAAAQLHHTNIVPVYAIGQEQGIHYYAMQYIDGHSLAEHLRTLRQAGRPPGSDHFARVARWGQQVAEALECAHAQGTIHRDIKPSNLLLDARDKVWVTDFGLARADAQATLTVSGDVVGTARYMSPEQVRGDRALVDRRTDIYSLGTTLYELLALIPPFDGESRDDVLNQIAGTEPKRLRRVNPAIPRDLETIVGKCMEKRPERRYARAQDVAEDCRRFLAREPIRARRTRAVVKAARFVRRHPLHAAGSAVALTLAIIALALVVHLRHVQGEQKVDAALSAILFERDARRATRLLDEARALGVDSARAYLYRGLVALSGKPQRALSPLLEALRRDPKSVETALALAYAYGMIGDAVNRRVFLDRHAEHEITTALGWHLRGLTLTSHDDQEAMKSFDRAIALQADFIPALECRAFSRASRVLVDGERAELEPMLRDYDAWVVFRPSSSGGYEARAMGRLFAAAYSATQADLRGKAAEYLADSRRDLDQALALRAPHNPLPYVRQGVYLEYVGDFRAAAESFGDAMAIDRTVRGENHVGYVHYRAVALHVLGELETALAEVVPASEALPAFWPLALQRGLLLADLGRLEEAQAVGLAWFHRERDDDTRVMIAAFLELLGDGEPAAALVRNLAAAPTSGESGAGDAPAGRPALSYLAGQMDGAGLLAAAGGHPGRRCQFAFLIGLRELARGEPDAARAALRACLDTGVIVFVEYRLAQVFLARVEQDAHWPAWLARAPSSS